MAEVSKMQYKIERIMWFQNVLFVPKFSVCSFYSRKGNLVNNGSCEHVNIETGIASLFTGQALKAL